MDIRLIRKFKEGRCRLIEEDLILQETDGEGQLGNFTAKKLYLVDVISNKRQEIVPEMQKFSLAGICDVTGSSDHVYFTTTGVPSGSLVQISLVKYSISQNSYEVLFSTEEDIVALGTTTTLRLFILDSNYIFVQKEIQKELQKPMPINIINSDYLRNYNGILDIENYLYSIEDDNKIEIMDEQIGRFGIDRIIKAEGNMCVIKAGYSVLEDRLPEDEAEHSLPEEYIGIINVKQFISDLVLKKEHVYVDILDQSSADRTFPYMKFKEGKIVYSRVDIKRCKEEVVIYEYNSKVTKIRVNNNLTRISDLWHTYIINDTPYLLSETEDSTELINLNIQKTEWKLGPEYKVKFITNDIIILEKRVTHGFIIKESVYILAYRFPNTEKEIFRVKAKYIGCIAADEDNLLIFSD